MRWPIIWLVALVAHSAGAAPIDGAAQRCLNGYNEALRQVSLQAGRGAWSCVRGALRGDESSLDACVAGDRGGAIAARQARVEALFAAGICDGEAPLQQGAAIANAAHRQAAIDLTHDLFDAPIGLLGAGPNDRACVDGAVGQAVLGLSTLVRAHRQCVARGLRQGVIVDQASLDETCGARSQLVAVGRAGGILGRAAAATGAACAARSTAPLFPGLATACHASPTVLAGCIERAAACRACLAVEASNWAPVADGSPRCDAFDDGEMNTSCGEFPYPPGARCEFGVDSRFLLASIGLPLSLRIQGTVRVACEAPGPDGRAPCSCDLRSPLAPEGVATLIIPAIGDVCFDHHPGCPAGAIDCDGGSAVDVDLHVDHNVGVCTGHADCAATCAAACAARGPGYAVAASACEGLCQEGAQDEAGCTMDGQCPGGVCVGRNGAHAGACNCSCRDTQLGAPAGPGALGCQLGMRMSVELPSNGVCDGAATLTYPPFCLALTTGNAGARIADANNHAGVTVNQYGTGVPHGEPIACSDLAQGRTSGLQLVGSAATLDSTLGDFLTTFRLACE